MSALRGARVLVTGGSGFLGGPIIRQLVGAGAEIHLFARETADLSRLLTRPGLFERHDGDLRTYSTVRRAVEKSAPDLVIHLAAAGVTDPFLPAQAALRHNLHGTLHLLGAVGSNAKMILARTPGERSAMNVYAASKAAVWQFARMYARTEGLPIQGVMPFQVYGPGQPNRHVIPSAIRSALSGEDFAMTPGTQVRDWVYVEDVARGFRQAAEQGSFDGRTVELGTGIGISLLSVIEKIYAMIERGGRPLPGRLPARPGEAPQQVAGAAATEQSIGWRARLPLEEGLRQVIVSLT